MITCRNTRGNTTGDAVTNAEHGAAAEHTGQLRNADCGTRVTPVRSAGKWPRCRQECVE